MMGNTNLPQFGAANTKNSRDTKAGDEQKTDEQKKEHKADPESPESIAPLAADRPKNAPARIPGQNINPNENTAK
jgi:hypothetical protein